MLLLFVGYLTVSKTVQCQMCRSLMNEELEGSNHEIVVLLAWYLPGGTEGATKILSQVRWCPG